MPPNTVKVDRATKWGNPYRIGECLRSDYPPMTAEQCVSYFEAWLHGLAFEHGQTVTEFLSPLRGKNLACWCKVGSACHADTLLKLANAERPHPQPDMRALGMEG